jgi:hypothetical protein
MCFRIFGNGLKEFGNVWTNVLEKTEYYKQSLKDDSHRSSEHQSVVHEDVRVNLKLDKIGS